MEKNLYETLKKISAERPKKPAIIFGKRKISYSELLRQIDRFAAVLRSRGLKKSDNIAVLLRNSPEFVISAFACFKIGAAVVPINYFLTTDEIVYILNDSRSCVLISGKEGRQHFEKLKEEANNIREILDWSEFSLYEGGDFPSVPSQNDTAAILYTSGTTGHPKGAILTHKNFMADVEFCLKVVRLNHKVRSLCFLPLFHSFAFTVCLLLPMSVGGSAVLLPSIVKGTTFLKLIFRKKITLFVSIPQVYKLFLKVPKLIGKIAFWRVKYFISGADSLSIKVISEFERKFGKKIIEGYGLTEAAPVATFNPPNKIKHGSIGKPLPGVEAKILNGEEKEVEPGEIGELVIKGDNVMTGYFEYPEATKNALKNGWLYTGDLAYRDEEGYIFIVDRFKDMFIHRGLNVYPREIENVLRDIPQIEEAAVIGQPLEDTFVPAAFVKATGKISEKEIIAACRKRLAAYKVPRKIVFVDDFPRTPTGKISKRKLKNFYFDHYR
ncbi:MAG: AMP-binding protein [Elusimicrobia bacterium]|nr:AMP-binding protein [Elusimicrobiota bacterium]